MTHNHSDVPINQNRYWKLVVLGISAPDQSKNVKKFPIQLFYSSFDNENETNKHPIKLPN